MLRQLTLVTALGLTAAGCASLGPAGAPGCDGSTRRPLNRSLWAWEEGMPLSPAAPASVEPPQETKPLARKAAVSRPAAVAGSEFGLGSKERRPTLDVAASLRACAGTAGEVRHG